MILMSSRNYQDAWISYPWNFYVYEIAGDGQRATSLEVMEFNEAMEITAHQELYDILEDFDPMGV